MVNFDVYQQNFFWKSCVRSGKAEIVNHIYNIEPDNKYEITAFVNSVQITFQSDTGSGETIILETL